jgi:GAF domain-containing protein
VLLYAVGIAMLVRNYRRSDEATQARLRWAILGMSTALALYSAYVVQVVAFFSAERSFVKSFSEFTAAQWLFAFAPLIVWPASFGYALLRERVIDVQFAVSRTVVYGIVSTIVLVFLAVLHWLLGRMIEHSGLAFGLEGLAAVGLGLVLHRASHGINVTVDRVLFRKHHAAEERLRQVTAALPYASTERSIAEALVNEPARNLKLASAALFYRDSPEGPLRRVRSEGWSESHASSLDPESFLVRYVQAEHTAVRLDDEQQWLPPGVPEGSARPVLAVPMVSQHALSAVVLYGSHGNGTLPDPDEVELLAALARAAATSHQQVRIATLTREKEAAEHQAETERARNAQLEASLQLLARERG